MNRAMLTFKRSLLSWGPRIKRAGYLTALDVEDLSGGDFRLIGRWNDGEYSQEFTRQYVLGRYLTHPPLQQRPMFRVCWYRDNFVRGALAARGV